MRYLPVLCLLIAELLAADALAQGAVRQPVRILVPLAAGSTSDIVARQLAAGVETAVGQPIVVENRPGASGRIAGEALARAAPDGSRFLLAPVAMVALAPLVFRHLPYDPIKDFAPVAQVAEFRYALAVERDHPARTLQELVAWARTNPARASYGTPGAGGVPHLFGVMIAGATGAPLVHVGYKGAPPIATDLLGGRIAAGISALSDFLELQRAERIRILAVSGSGRSPLAPEIGTFGEQGFPAVAGTGWTALFAPPGTPQPVIDRWSTAVRAALRDPDLRARLIALGVEPTGTTPEALAVIIATDAARWAPIVRASNFSVD